MILWGQNAKSISGAEEDVKAGMKQGSVCNFETKSDATMAWQPSWGPKAEEESRYTGRTTVKVLNKIRE